MRFVRKKKNLKNYKIAVEFDGTIVENCYPEIGSELAFAFHCLQAFQDDGDQLILWTRRQGKELNQAVDYCSRKGVSFYAINRNYPEEKIGQTAYSRKVNADYFIDYRNVGGLPDWTQIYQLIHPSN